MLEMAKLPVTCTISPKDGHVRVEWVSTSNELNGSDELDYGFSLTPAMAIELGRRLIGAALTVYADYDDKMEKKREGMS